MGSAPLDEEGAPTTSLNYRLECGAAAKTAARERRAFVVNDVASDPRVNRAEALGEQGIRSLAALPLLAGGEPVGAFTLYSNEADYFDAQEMELLAELAGDISFALEHIQRAEQLEYLTFYDSLTGLANRTLFLDRLSQRLRMAVGANDRVAVVLSDINRLRTVNDSLGRRAGDELLKQFSERLARRTSRDDLARLGADNFAIVLAANGGEPELTARLAKCWETPSTSPSRSRARTCRSPSSAAFRCIRRTAWTPSHCCATPNSPCAGRRIPAREGCFTPRNSARRATSGCRSRTACGAPCATTSSCCTTSRRSIWPRAPSWASRP